MKFGVINTFNIIVTIILLFPNIIYSLKNRNKLNHISLFEIITFVGSILLFISRPLFILGQVSLQEKERIWTTK